MGSGAKRACLTHWHRRLPPYGRSVAAAVARGERLNVWVYGGSRAWEEARLRTRHSGPALLLPPGDDPGQYKWPVEGLEVMLVWLDGSPSQPRQDATPQELIHFAEVLVQNGARLVVAPCPADSEGCIFVRPRRSGAAA